VVALILACDRSGPAVNSSSDAKRKDDAMTFKPIGVIHSPYTPARGAPRQGMLAPDVASTIVVDPEFEEGLTDIETFSHIIVIYAFDRSTGWSPMVRTPWEERKHGVFATRSPRRPNPIGMTVVKQVEREGRMLRVLGLDAFEGTPLLDLKPYVPKFDCVENSAGWLQRMKPPVAPDETDE
jgi:tRNA-Thr(GGU) m(6)t(6)A37 methyltransferase TsaA